MIVSSQRAPVREIRARCGCGLVSPPKPGILLRRCRQKSKKTSAKTLRGKKTCGQYNVNRDFFVLGLFGAPLGRALFPLVSSWPLWGRLGPLLGWSWDPPGASWRPPGAPWAPLGVVLGVSGVALGCPGLVLGWSRGSLGPTSESAGLVLGSPGLN